MLPITYIFDLAFFNPWPFALGFFGVSMVAYPVLLGFRLLAKWFL